MDFLSFFSAITHNSSVNFQLKHFLHWAKGYHESTNFHALKCSDENFLNSSCHFSNQTSVFLQILHDSSVSWKIFPRYFFRLNVIFSAWKGQIKVQIFETFENCDQNSLNSFYFWNNKLFFFSNFASLFSVMRHKSSVPF